MLELAQSTNVSMTLDEAPTRSEWRNFYQQGIEAQTQ
jgi:hypothetical protein